MPEPETTQPEESGHEAAPGVRVPDAALDYTFVRSSGPGGQAVNKLSTAVQLRLRVDAIEGLTPGAAERLRRNAGRRLTKADEILIQSQVHRSQLDNRRACLERLLALIAESVPPPRVRRKKKLTKAQKQKRLEAKRRQSEKKDRRRGSDY